MKESQRIFYALLVFLMLLVIGWGSVSAGAEGLAFGMFASLIISGGLVCIWERSVVRSAFALMATFGGVAGLFLLLGADFVALAQILIYVGGILVLILFGVMLSPPDLSERKLPRVLGGLVAGLLVLGWFGAKVAATAQWATDAELPPIRSHAREVGVAFLSADEYVVAFELAAVVLTVALVAAVYIARRRTTDFEERGNN